MSPSPNQPSNSANNCGSHTRGSSKPTTPSAIPLPPSPPENTTNDQNTTPNTLSAAILYSKSMLKNSFSAGWIQSSTTPATPATTIPQPKSASKLKNSYPTDWFQSNVPDIKTNLTFSVGRPPMPRNRNHRGITAQTPFPNPFLSVGRKSESPERRNKNLRSNTTTPADSLTTPNSRMIFKMDMDEDKRKK